MKTFAISLARAKDRRTYITQHLQKMGLDWSIIEGVDGRQLSETQLEELCNMQQVNHLRWWLTNGAIGCALSHRAAWQRIVDEQLDMAFIVEDDVILPPDIIQTLDFVRHNIKEDEIVLLYCTLREPTLFSNQGQIKQGDYNLFYPMQLEQIFGAVAYIVPLKAAQKMVQYNSPIHITSDCWHQYHKGKAFDSLRVLYPRRIKTGELESSIGYLSTDSWKARLSKWIQRHKIPILYQIIKGKRQRQLNKGTDFFRFTNEPSPLHHDR